MLNRILARKAAFFRAELFDVAEQRELNAAEFRLALSFKTAVGCKLVFRSDKYGLIVPFTLETRSDRVCRVKIENGAIVEQNSIRWRLMRLSVLPELMTTDTGSEGHYLLPVYSGALADFRERPPCRNSDRIYLEQREWEKFSMMNCFGCLKKSQNIFAVVDSGDFACRVDSEFNQAGKNRLYATFLIRKKPSDMPKFEDLSVRFYDAGEDAGYGDFAKLFRTYLLEERGASLLRDRAENNPALAYSIDALRVKIFLAQKHPYLPDGSSPVKVHTTCEEACRIIDALKEAGIDKAVITLVGWNLGGHDGAYPTHFPVEPTIGGEAGLRNLIAHAKEVGYQIVPHDNVTDIYRGSPDFDYEYVARDEGQEPVAAGIWGGGQSYKTCPLVYLQRWGYEFERIRQLGFEGHYYMDAQSTVLWTCHSPKHPAGEKEFALALASITAIPRTLYGAVSIECPSVYSIPFIDEASTIHCPLDDPFLTGRMPAPLRSLDIAPVPFFHIALHGLILYQGRWVHTYRDPVLGLLRELAFGARPSMEVSYRDNGGNGGNYRKSIALLKEAYLRCFHELKLQCETIESFREPYRGFFEAVYSNGCKVTVNVSDREMEGLPPGSWKASRTEVPAR